MTLSKLTPQERIAIRNINRFLLKYTPFFAALMYTVFCLLRSFGFHNHMITSFMAYSGFLWAPFHFASSYSSGFCKWHRRLIWYHGITGTMVFLEMWIGFGDLRPLLNIVFFLWGAIVCGIVGYKIAKGEFKCERTDL